MFQNVAITRFPRFVYEGVAIAKVGAPALAQLRSVQLEITDLLMPTLIERDARYRSHCRILNPKLR
jgi:hypothetical protein